MLLQEKLEKINYIEQHFDIHSLRYKDICIWPLIRSIVVIDSDHRKSNNFGRKNVVNKLSGLLKILKKYVQSRIVDYAHTSRPIEQSDFLIIDYDQYRNIKLGSSYFSRFADALAAFIKKTYTCQILEYQDPEATPRMPRTSNVRLLDLHVFYAIIRRAFTKNEKINNYDAFEKFLEASKLKDFIALSESVLLHRLEQIFYFKQYFEQLLPKIQPKAAFVIGYFSNCNLGLILACKAKGIKTVELQHGQQGVYHLNTFWENVPQNGFEMLPEYFWMWGKISQDRILQWTQKQAYHKAILGGNPWLSYYANELKSIEPKKVSERRNILVCCQYPDDFFNSYLAEAMAQTQDQYHYMIRLHPRFLSEKKKFKDHLAQYELSNYEMESATQDMIYDVIARSDLLVTWWSTTAYEALAFGVHSILIHPHGKASMGHNIDAGVFAYADNQNDFVQALGSKFNKETNAFMETEPNHIHASLENIISA